MPSYSDSLRGYAFNVLKRDGFACRYCGLDGSVWPYWLYLSWDHLLPRNDPRREEDERGEQKFIVAACVFCNVLHNRTVFDVDGKSPDQLVDQKRPFVLERREQYREFWEANVAGGAATS